MDAIVSCANAPLCGTADLPVWVANLLRGRCIRCNTVYMSTFVFSDATQGESCPVCLEDCNKFVTYRCGHRVCAPCFSSVKKTLPDRLPPHPEDFGCIPFHEEDYDVTMDEWAMIFPLQYNAYSDAVNAYSRLLVDFNRRKRHLMSRCPLCREKCSPASFILE